MPAGGKTHQQRWGGGVGGRGGVPWRSRLWLTEQPCLAISEVFTRAITVIIISTIPCHALSWDASAALARGSLPAAGFLGGIFFSQLLVGVEVSGNSSLRREGVVTGGGHR